MALGQACLLRQTMTAEQVFCIMTSHQSLPVSEPFAISTMLIRTRTPAALPERTVLGAGPCAPQNVAIGHTLFQLLSPELGDTAMQWTVRRSPVTQAKETAPHSPIVGLAEVHIHLQAP